MVTHMDIAHRCGETGNNEPLYTDHSENGSNSGHLNIVAELTAQFAEALSPYYSDIWKKWGFLTGLWHDLGKFSREFQNYIRGKVKGRYDHSTAGALHAMKRFPVVGDLMAYAMAGHHGGIPNGTLLFGERIMKTLPEWKRYVPGDLLSAGEERLSLPIRFASMPDNLGELGFTLAMQVRMLFSCLVDADFLGTEAFMNPARFQERPQWPKDILSTMSQTLEDYLSNKERNAHASNHVSGKMSALRAAIHARCLEQGGCLPRGVYRLNVPTGGGKTLSSLSFALRHACNHGMERVIYVIPYTSIIDQTASEFRNVFSSLSNEIGEECVLAYHSNIEPEQDTVEARLMSENWDAPLVVTTGVQFFESLFSNKPSRCRKLHRCGNAVIVFDEAQCLPSSLLGPCLETMKCLNRDYGSSLVLCTATQPGFERDELFPIGWDAGETVSLLGTEMEDTLNGAMRRVEIRQLEPSLTCEDLVRHYHNTYGETSALMIVNTTRHAAELFNQMRRVCDEDSLFHLSARMVPIHRRHVLKLVRKRLSEGRKVVLIATRVVEAGVDLSFPIVYRSQAGLDSLAQAAGRCNRHGEMKSGGTVFSFTSSDFPIPPVLDDLLAASAAARDAWTDGKDVFEQDVISRYFKLYYDNRKYQTKQWGKDSFFQFCQVNPTSAEGFQTIQFEELTAQFHMIPPGQHEIVLAIDSQGEDIICQLEHLDKLPEGCRYPNRELRRNVAQYSIQIYEHEYLMLRQRGILASFAGDTVEVVTDVPNVYDPNTGFLPMTEYSPVRSHYITNDQS